MTHITIPKAFFIDHMERDLDTPEIIKSLKRSFTIASDDPALPELINDAKHYVHPYGPDYVPMRIAARHLLRALIVQGIKP